jgi:hypothetical protein
MIPRSSIPQGATGCAGEELIKNLAGAGIVIDKAVE